MLRHPPLLKVALLYVELVDQCMLNATPSMHCVETSNPALVNSTKTQTQTYEKHKSIPLRRRSLQIPIPSNPSSQIRRSLTALPHSSGSPFPESILQRAQNQLSQPTISR